ncbi:penicillin-binding protein 2 [Chrysiogenes arsenatis]|uniref:penicillin-binding protein 2 n=1 Tax=Chrysiogenes arsenatis TaxID=309797 RepID=UPI0004277F17|nr:penicillin-binding protein 2 [Chrysiogenes arsenatis]
MYGQRDTLTTSQQRLVFYLAVILAGLFVLGFRLWYMQVLHHESFLQKAERNRIRTYEIKAPRGNIYDRNGELLVTNTPSYNLVVTKEDVRDEDALFGFLHDYFEIDTQEFQVTYRRAQRFQQLAVKRDITFEQVSFVEAHRYEYPGLRVEAVSKRHYVYKSLAAHVFGYIGEISESQMKSEAYQGYAMGDLVGQNGIEASYESHLRGVAGSVTYEVNARNRPIRVVDRVEPISGKPITLAIDARLQRKMDEFFLEESGVAMVMDVATGEMLAIGSYPAYDPNLFAAGISTQDWRALNNNPQHPLRDKSIRGTYPPGSVFKAITALAGLETGVLTERSSVFSSGVYQLGNRSYRDWKKGGHGHTNIYKSLEESVDTYYYHFGLEIGVDNIAKYGLMMGLGKLTGIDLPGERVGILPTRQWKREARGEPWYPGDTIPVSIGQGYVTLTPLQINVMMAAIANGGKVLVPRVATHLDNTQSYSVMFERAAVQDKNLAIIRKGLELVITGEHGTGRRMALKDIPLAGKSGTSQVISIPPDEKYDADKIPKKYWDHAWFSGYAPANDPRIAITVFVLNGGSGSRMAGPIFRDLAAYALRDLQIQ